MTEKKWQMKVKCSKCKKTLEENESEHYGEGGVWWSDCKAYEKECAKPTQKQLKSLQKIMGS